MRRIKSLVGLLTALTLVLAPTAASIDVSTSSFSRVVNGRRQSSRLCPSIVRCR